MRDYPDKTFTSALGNRVVQPTLTQTDRSMRKILLVDNEEGQCLLYEQGLNEEGYLVFCARNGKEALKRLEESPCDLVILDIMMPEMDGIEVLGKIVSRYKKLPIILHSAYSHYQSDFMTWLADAFVVKSSDLSVLKNTVKELLRRNSEEKDGRGVSAQEIRGFYETNP